MESTKTITTGGKLSLLDKLLPVLILAAMGIGLLLGKYVPESKGLFTAVQIDNVSLPIAIGLLWMMYPVLAKVRYEKIGGSLRDWRLFGVSLSLNWIIGPLLMLGLAWLFLPDKPGFRNGIILIGLARCIAMVLIWNQLAKGDNDKCAILVALNSVFQILTYSFLAYLFIGAANVSMWGVAKSVLIFLGIPLAAGFITRIILRPLKGAEWYDKKFSRILGPTALIGLLFTILVMFSTQGDKIIAQPLDIVRIAIPLTVYFFVMFAISFIGSWLLKFNYPTTVALSFTAASNNFELAIAVAVATFTIASDEALATVVGPLIEVPVLLALVYVALWLGRVLFKRTAGAARSPAG
ncbi:MAG: ACR3 family arsenite efflux transporter [bacterium]|nr:ACR3 family arsenite efflux transporter [bacterium]